MMNYYPPTLSLSSIIRQFPEMELVDATEKQRLQDVEDRKKRGKGAPKKAKSKGPSHPTRLPPIPRLTFSFAFLVFQRTVGVHRESGRDGAENVFCGRLAEVETLSNPECINSSIVVPPCSRSMCLVLYYRSPLHRTFLFPSPLHNPPSFHLFLKCLQFPSSPLSPQTPPQTITFIRPMAPSLITTGEPSCFGASTFLGRPRLRSINLHMSSTSSARTEERVSWGARSI